MLPKTIIQKILNYKANYAGIKQTARALGISRYAVGYWWGNWKRKPKKTYEAIDLDAELKRLRLEKMIIEDDILKGRFDQDNPVSEGRRLRKEFIAKYDLEPEKLY